MMPVRKSKTNAPPPSSGPEDEREHEAGLSAESLRLLLAGMDDVRSGRMRRMGPNEFDDE